MDDEPVERIPKSKAEQMIGVAVILELIGIIPLVHIVIAIGNLVLYPLWFSSLGASYFKDPKDLKMFWWTLVTFLIGLIPVIGEILPELTTGVVRNVLYVQAQDRKAIKEWRERKAKEAVDQKRAATERYRLLKARNESGNGSGESEEGGQAPETLGRIGPGSVAANAKPAPNRVDSIRRAA